LFLPWSCWPLSAPRALVEQARENDTAAAIAKWQIARLVVEMVVI
jgi:hypothetical protein